MSRIGIIGGSGLYQIEGLKKISEIKIDTPYGAPSDTYVLGALEGREIVFLPRHGKGHRILPTELNNKANIYGMKKLDVTYIISVSAVGSLRPELKPQDVVIIDQFFDRTNQARNNTFFGCYATLAMVTDFDCWYEEETGSTVSAEMILENIHKNVETAKNIIKHAVKFIPEAHECECSNALANSLVTDKSMWPQEIVRKLGPIIEKYL